MMILRILIALSLSLLTSIGGYKKKAVDKSGAIAGFCVGFCCGMGGLRSLSCLFFFFISSSIMTRLKSKRKEKIEDGYKKGGQRNYIQVFSNALTACLCSLLALYALYLTNNAFIWGEPVIDFKNEILFSMFMFGIIGHYSCCNGDTWASELGTAFGSSNPFLLIGIDKNKKLILCKRVKVGTNGGMSFFGTLGSLLGGVFIGIAFIFPIFGLRLLYYVSYQFLPFSLFQLIVDSLLFGTTSSTLSDFIDFDSSSFLDLFIYNNDFIYPILIGSFGGFFGSLLDSILGGTLQYSAFDEKKKKVIEIYHESHLINDPSIKHITGFSILDNHQVNFISSLLTAFSCSLLGYILYSCF
eukprot:TRINITY_DN125_c0_g1_i1.p1 TRINITY_DN125_c0_g1~~TRINITY_DN125_c0_g1_i1.p1  ORF type:complete len:355 (-),score=87.79 TRINITY_DN125_c0_g1_i1:108-1172(-)